MSIKSTAVASFLLVACSGKQETDQMTKYADQMCARKDIKCAEKLLPEIEKWTGEYEGKEVNEGAATRYNAQLTRAQKCYDALMASPASK